MAQATLRKVLMEQDLIEPTIMDDLMLSSGILQTARAKAASHDAWHKYKQLEALPTFARINVGGSYVPQTINKTNAQNDLVIFVAGQDEPAHEADTYPGGPAKQFEDDKPAFVEAWGQTLAKGIIYGNNSTFGYVDGFPGLHAYAALKGNIVSKMTGTTGSRTSIFAVKWSNNCSLLYNAKLAAGENFLKIEVLNNGQKVTKVTNVTTGAEQLVYQVVYSGWVGFFSATKFDISAITQIQDATNKKPTASDMDKLVDKVKGSASDTVIYCNRTSKRLLGEIKDSKLKTGVTDSDYNTLIDTWNGIPLIIDENILDTETTALD